MQRRYVTVRTRKPVRRVRIVRGPTVPTYKRISGRQRGHSYNYTQTYRGAFIESSPNSVTYTTGAMFFTISSIPNWAALRDLYDTYMISKVRVLFLPTGQFYGNAYPDIAKLPTIYTAIDYNDAVAPSTSVAGVDELLQYSTCKFNSAVRKFSRTFTPAIAAQAYQAGVVPGYQVKKRQWLAVANDTVQHYGLKWVLPPTIQSGTANLIQYQLLITYWIRFKSVK